MNFFKIMDNPNLKKWPHIICIINFLKKKLIVGPVTSDGRRHQWACIARTLSIFKNGTICYLSKK